VLATRVGGLPEFVRETGNQLVEPAVADLATGLNRWLGQQMERDALEKRNRQRAMSYTWDRVIDRYEETLKGSL
jgi:glycosyltransferase involved in cell wall biosynthesis